MEFANNEVYVPNLAPNRGEGELRILPPKLLQIIFCVDVSINMKKENRIAAVNDIISQMAREIAILQADVTDEYDIRISIITFDRNTEVKVPPTPAMDFENVNLECSEDSCCNVGSAFRILKEKLTRRDWFNTEGKKAAPIIVLMTGIDQIPEENWVQDLELLYENGWFEASQRSAVLVGERTNCSEETRRLAEKFVSSPDEAIFDIESVGPSVIDVIEFMLKFRWHRPSVKIHHEVSEEIGKADISDLPPGWDDGWDSDWPFSDSDILGDSNDYFV